MMGSIEGVSSGGGRAIPEEELDSLRNALTPKLLVTLLCIASNWRMRGHETPRDVIHERIKMGK